VSDAVIHWLRGQLGIGATDTDVVVAKCDTLIPQTGLMRVVFGRRSVRGSEHGYRILTRLSGGERGYFLDLPLCIREQINGPVADEALEFFSASGVLRIDLTKGKARPTVPTHLPLMPQMTTQQVGLFWQSLAGLGYSTSPAACAAVIQSYIDAVGK
jgi:hypothetical protein